MLKLQHVTVTLHSDKKFENWSVFDEVIKRTKCANFLGHAVCPPMLVVVVLECTCRRYW